MQLRGMLRRLIKPFSSNKHNYYTARPMDQAASATNTTERLSSLRTLMRKCNIQLYVVPSEDSHQSEYTCPADARRAYISGFTGSAGCAVITETKAALFTDGRYFNQAGKQLDSNWTLMKYGLPDVLSWQEWTIAEAKSGKSVGVDATLLTFSQAKKLQDDLQSQSEAKLVPMDCNLIDDVWAKQRPARPTRPVFVLETKYTGKSVADKLLELRKAIEKRSAEGFVVSALDEIAWLFNLRGDDIPYNPVFFSYALVTMTNTTLYIHESQLNDGIKKHLGDHVKIAPFYAIFADSTILSKTLEAKKKILVAKTASWALVNALGQNNVEEIQSPIQMAKAVKNDVELDGMRKCHIRDGASLIEYFAWLEDSLKDGSSLDEVDVSDKLEQIRKGKENYAGLSFPTISSTGPNGAIIHYQPEKGSCAVVDPSAIYLCDSGAQDGTTDVTRTVHHRTPNAFEKEAYTLVLKGHISLARAVFPKGTTGFAIDVLARQHLWIQGLDYRHGTGHGVGAFLNVHEGPAGIGTRLAFSEVALDAGMVLSNEPGYYEDGKFGIRLENLVIVKEVETQHRFGDRSYFGFETITMCPFASNLIEKSMLTNDDIHWLNAYHKQVLEKTKSFLKGNPQALAWLERETRVI
ncbi:putative Xaa-Pro aminopeptidase P [Neolecta irregularis DAH-3]|uniref:Xaa-Pro aminopeptidase n=1 Tax=Neolecta irregularis (strain DAH-3) TaxID=1198029 RepID=A0A1U7LSV9_NEOID|nr:putative Xaa-Pro aminopeptidase P [Neolecta irregularis DAH-3]|eukprot:OLL25747.1 putative Xaa-Pro aminopeptidase P [Neolecta irregularis DAH-3]